MAEESEAQQKGCHYLDIYVYIIYNIYIYI